MNSLILADKLRAKSIAFPCISTGVFLYPNDEAAIVAIRTVKRYLMEDKTSLDEIIFVTFKELDYKLYHNVLNENAN